MSVNGISFKNENKIGKTVFPNDWSIYILNDILKLVKRPLKMEEQHVYNLVTVKRRFGGMVDRGMLRGDQIEVKSQFFIQSGDFVISKRQISHGACAIVPEGLHGSIVSNEYNVLRNKEELDLEFFNWYVQLPFMQRNFYLSSDGVHIEKLLFKLEDWLRRKVCIPDVNEQVRIAKIISTWEKAIDLKERLIEEKKEQKKGLMQKLLTGDLRLPGFKKEWNYFKIKEVCNVVSGGTPSTNDGKNWGGNIPWCTPSDITSSGKYIQNTKKSITDKGLKKVQQIFFLKIVF
ncbi:restriction endonuclease subunit S [Bacillus tamaricis]|uniref:Restriction endonuclease subunit S n=1 Tax=Evansella tamaricis TaxID=2069301 RepID=A0ABS6JEK6_9BACI|nr:restriction endonuclease subunit S [Evansella tamaricis]MBU9710885.1 restriction endonuclease subunit S [Evansella tamaricis]